MGGGVLLDLSHELDYAQYLFGKIKTINSFNKKISNLEINSDDILILLSKTNKIKLIKITLSYFSKFEERKIYLYGDNLQIEADLINSRVKTIRKDKIKIKNFNFKINQTYLEMHKSIFRKNFNKICNLNEAIELNNYMLSIKNK